MVLELENLRFGTELLKRGFAKMQKGGVIMDFSAPHQKRRSHERPGCGHNSRGGSSANEGLVSAKNRYRLAKLYII